MSTANLTLQSYLNGTVVIPESKPEISPSEDAAAIIKELDRAVIEKERKQPERKYLGASSLGDPCARKLQYRYMGQQKDKVVPQ